MALVTGAGQRLGQVIAQHLATRGYAIAVHYSHSEQGAYDTVNRIVSEAGQARAFAADLTQPEAIQTLIENVTGHFGELDLLVGNAANFERVTPDAWCLGHWERAMNLNARANYLLAIHTKEMLKRKRGSMVFITCTSATQPYAHYLPYVVSKAATRQLMRALAIELAPEVRVNAVAPGTVLPPTELSEDAVEAIVSRTLAKRIGSPLDIAEAVAYLASADFVTGQELIVDGGATVRSRS